MDVIKMKIEGASGSKMKKAFSVAQKMQARDMQRKISTSNMRRQATNLKAGGGFPGWGNMKKKAMSYQPSKQLKTIPEEPQLTAEQKEVEKSL
jgi:hypothetical protein